MTSVTMPSSKKNVSMRENACTDYGGLDSVKNKKNRVGKFCYEFSGV